MNSAMTMTGPDGSNGHVRQRIITFLIAFGLSGTLALFSGCSSRRPAPPPPPAPVTTGNVNVRVIRADPTNTGLNDVTVKFVVKGDKLSSFKTDSAGWAKVKGVNPGARHLYVSKSGYRSHNRHFKVIKGKTVTITVALVKTGGAPQPPPPGPGPVPPLTSDKVTSLKRIAQAYLSEYENAHVGRVPNTHQPKQEAFVRRVAAILRYGAPTLGIKADGKTMLLGQRGGSVIAQDAVIYDGSYYDFIIGAGTQGRDLTRLVWHRGGPQGDARAIQPDRNLVPKGSGGRTPPQGAVKADRHAFRDRRGAFIPVGSTFFSAVWAYQHDRETLKANAKWFADRGGDYFRILVEVGGFYWDDRLMNPHASGAEAALAGTIDLLYSYGLRTQITIFGGTDFSKTAAQRAAVVDQVARVVNGREQKVIYVEIGNESWQTFDNGRFPDEIRSLASQFRQREPNVLLALTAPYDANQARTLYSGSAATVFTTHIERSSGNGIRIPDVAKISGIPALRSSGEPRGPGASAGGDVSDPATLIKDFRDTINAGIGAYCYHSEAGVWMGNKNARSKKHLWDHSTADAIVRGIVKARNAFPGDQANR